MNLKGKNAIVTGGSIGIGTTLALTLAKAGASVAINYRRHDTEAMKVVEDIEALGAKGIAVQADVSVYADAEKMVRTVVEELGRLDIMICNAGIT